MLIYNNSRQFINDYRALLKSHGVTSAHVARQIGISPQQLNNIYNKQGLTASDIQNLCRAIGYKCIIDIHYK